MHYKILFEAIINIFMYIKYSCRTVLTSFFHHNTVVSPQKVCEKDCLGGYQ